MYMFTEAKMVSLNRIRRQASAGRAERLARYATLSALMDLLDAFQFKRAEGRKTTMIASIGLFRQEFIGQSVGDFAEPLGKWLVSLPKEIWEEKRKEVNQIYKDLQG